MLAEAAWREDLEHFPIPSSKRTSSGEAGPYLSPVSWLTHRMDLITSFFFLVRIPHASVTSSWGNSVTSNTSATSFAVTAKRTRSVSFGTETVFSSLVVLVRTEIGRLGLIHGLLCISALAAKLQKQLFTQPYFWPLVIYGRSREIFYKINLTTVADVQLQSKKSVCIKFPCRSR